MIDKSLPEEYQNETDYRKIPREYLDSNIPQGRGMVKWQPMATLPQQFKAIDDFVEEQNKISRPILSEEQLERLNFMSQIKIQQNEIATLSYYNNGYIFSIVGYIREIDEIRNVLVLTNEEGNEQKKINLIDIVNIE